MEITKLVTGGGVFMRPRTDALGTNAYGATAAHIVDDRASLEIASTHHLPSITG